MPFPFGFRPDNDSDPYDLSDAELAGHSGALPMDTAEQKYLQRDGGDIQGLGVGIEAYTFSCFYLGENYDARFRALRAAFNRQPKGLLSHPELGNIRAHCLGITDYAMDYMRERECINFRISFKQDATDVTNYVIKVPSVASKGSALINTLRSAAPVISAVAAAATFVAKLPNTANVVRTDLTRTFEALTNFAVLFVTSAVKAATLGQVDFTLQAQRDRVFAQADATTKALRETGLPDATLYPSLAAVQSTYAQTLELDTLVRTQTPKIETYTTQGRIPIVVLSAQRYGSPDAMAHIDEIRVNNHIGTFGIMPGVELRLAGSTSGGSASQP